MNNLYEHIKNKAVIVGNVYQNKEGYYLTIVDVCLCKDKYKTYPIFNSLLHNIFKPEPISKALNWTFTVKYQSRITFTDGEEIRGISSTNIMDVEYDERGYKSYKAYKEYEKYVLVNDTFPTTPLIKDIRKKKK